MAREFWRSTVSPSYYLVADCDTGELERNPDYIQDNCPSEFDFKSIPSIKKYYNDAHFTERMG